MFDKILEISSRKATIKLIHPQLSNDILNAHVVFEDKERKVLGEIEKISEECIDVSLLGEFINNDYVDGVIRKPSMASSVRMINDNEIKILINANDNESVILGLSPLYSNIKIKANINKFFSNHTAMFGNTGSGKTYGIARIIQNLFSIPNAIPYNSVFFIFNTYSEYHNAFKDINKLNANLNYRKYTTNIKQTDEELISIPLWLLDVDDYANLLDITEYNQIMIIEKMLNYVCVFAKNDDESRKYKNHLIAKAILSVMFSNQLSARIRDQIFTILENCSTPELNLDFEVPGVGYKRQVRKCFDIDSQGDFVERILITQYIESFIDNDKEWKEQYEPIFFTLKDLEVSLNFALISEGLILNEKSYSEAIALKVRLHQMLKEQYSNYFKYKEFVTLDQYIASLILINNNKRAQIINFTLEDIDDRFAKTITKIYSRLLFKWTKNLKSRASVPIHIMLEEAHRYVQKDKDIEILGYNIFDRIAKEGRKYGLLLDLITQRPTELSEAAISQCSNFLIFKINHPDDLEYIKKMVPNMSLDVLEKQKNLQPGTCVAFGSIMKIPMIIKMELPNPEPYSSNCQIYNKWMIPMNKNN